MDNKWDSFMKGIDMFSEDFMEDGREALSVFQKDEEAFKGAAEDGGFRSEKEMQNYMKEIRKEAKCI
jgi:hypothetical protein